MKARTCVYAGPASVRTGQDVGALSWARRKKHELQGGKFMLVLDWCHFAESEDPRRPEQDQGHPPR